MSASERELTDAKIAKYLDLTQRALAKLKLAMPERSHLRRVAEDFLTMARSYHEDARHFAAKGDYVNAFACVNYAHGWVDAGARLGFWDVEGDDQLFTLAE